MIADAFKRRVAVVFVTHDAQLASWAERVISLRDGKVVNATEPTLNTRWHLVQPYSDDCDDDIGPSIRRSRD